ncbi:MAG: glycosyltransferase [Hyphomicrobiales bacterium]|nr:glycosyltransferase [Hyphomicrobiales bacterium]
MNIGYLVNQYPKTSHSFIRREIAALESLGLTIHRYTLRRTKEALADEADGRELSRTAAVIARPFLPRLMDALRTIARNPMRFAKGLAFAIRCGLKSDRSAAVHMAYLLEAAVLATWFRRDKITHLHAHFGTNSAMVGMLVNRLSGIPWSFTAHGPEEFNRPLGIALSEKVRSANFAVAISSFGRSQLWRWSDHAQWKKVHVVHCGLDAAFTEGEARPIPAPPRLVCVGRLCEQKGQLLLVEAGQILKRRGVVFDIVLAGDGPLRQEIEAAISKAGLEDCFTITGWISGQRVRQEIEKARALVLPSFAEGLPVAIMEAMALGRPVVSTMVAGIPELVSPGETGWLVPAGDVAALAQAISEVLALAPETLAAMGGRGRSRALERHNARTEAAKLKLLFEGQGT